MDLFKALWKKKKKCCMKMLIVSNELHPNPIYLFVIINILYKIKEHFLSNDKIIPLEVTLGQQLLHG